MASKQHACLDSFIDKYKDLPKQGTDAWKLLRMKSFGGSEVATLLDQNPYQTRRDLIMKKAVPSTDTFNGGPATYWGKLFEDVTQAYIEHTWGIKIYETSSIPGANRMCSYSPDGLAVAIPPGETEPMIVLFEIKSPKSREPTGTIPDMYRPQPTYGMMVIPIVQIAFFVDACYRKCTYEDLLNGLVYDTKYHRKFKYDTLYAYGIIGIYYVPNDATTADAITADATTARHPLDFDPLDFRQGVADYDIYDFGRSSKDDFDKMLKRYDMGVYKRYIPKIGQSPDDQLFDFMEFCAGNDVKRVGVIPWKLLQYYEIRIERDPEFERSLMSRISESYSMLEPCWDSDDPMTEFKKQYPENIEPTLTVDDTQDALAFLTTAEDIPDQVIPVTTYQQKNMIDSALDFLSVQ